MTTNDNEPLIPNRLSPEASERFKALAKEHGFGHAVHCPGGLTFVEGEVPAWMTDFIAGLGPADFAPATTH